MGHDASKVQLGSTRSNIKEVDNRAGTIEAGLAVRLKSDNTISTALADGNLLGISLGGSLTKGYARTAIARKGLDVPVQVTSAFTPTLGAQVNISDTTGKAIASGAGATAVNAIYSSGILSGVKEDGTTLVDVVLIDFIGGL